MNKPFTTVAVFLLSLIALLQLLRVLMGWVVTVNALIIPLWVSMIAFVVATVLAALVWHEMQRD